MTEESHFNNIFQVLKGFPPICFVGTARLLVAIKIYRGSSSPGGYKNNGYLGSQYE